MSPKFYEHDLTNAYLFQMNVFHWHIVDSHSFPVELTGEKTKLMAQYGAYDAASIYSQQEIRDLVEYANYRGKGKILFIFFKSFVFKILWILLPFH